MLFEPLDPNSRFRERRAQALRRKRRRRAALVGVVLASGAVVAGGAQLYDSHPGTRSGGAKPNATSTAATTAAAATTPAAPAVSTARRPVPAEIRGVHVTIALASLPGKLEEYMRMRSAGLNTIELDVKDENGEIGFVPSSVPLASRVGAAMRYYKPREAVRLARKHGLYLIGRVVIFEDPKLSTGRPDLAIRRADGSVWTNAAGLGWTNPYDRRVWDYNVSIAEVAARAGFDEIQLDYVRFPSDGDIETAVFAHKTSTPPAWVIPQFVQYAAKRLKPLGVRLSADVFGLSATRDLGIGQMPRRISRYLDAVYPMTYPSHYSAGEYGIADPSAQPGETVFNSLADFRRELRGRKTDIVPWVQDFTLGRTYTLTEVRAQIESARLQDARGYLLWNPSGVYTDGALVPPG
jgi:hypothetical protein